MEINGFKIFNKDMTNSNGVHFETNKTYCISGELKYGPEGNGLHFCRRLEDTLRFMNRKDKEGIICSVISKGDIVENNRLEDEYYGYFDMYATNKLFVEKALERKEIINYFLKMDNYIRIDRFLQGYKLTEQEIALFKLKFRNINHILKTISYYQEKNIDAYKLSSSKNENIKCFIKDKKTT